MDKINELNEELIEESDEIESSVTMEEAVGPYDMYFFTLDEIISNLKKCKEKGDNIYTFFWGNKLYSLFDDEDSCYKKVTGMTKAEYDKMKKEQYNGKYTPLEIEHIKRKSTHNSTKLFTFNDVVDFLEKYKKANKNIYIYYNYEKLYSLLDDKESCYEKILGKTIEDVDKNVDDFEKRYAEIEAKRKENADKNYKEWIERGIKLIYPQKKTEWENCVLECMSSIYHGKEIETALKVMETLVEPENNFSLAKRHLILIDNNRTESSYDKTVQIVLNFSKKGVEFIRYLEPVKCNKKPLKKLIAKVEQENLKYFEEIKSDKLNSNL